MGKVSVRDVGLNAALMFCSLVFRTGNAGRAEAQPIVEAAPPQAADLLPASTAYFVEVSRPLGLIDSVFEHPLRARIEQLELYQRAMQAPQYLQSRLGLTVLEFTLGMDWRQAIDVLSGEGLYAAFDPATQGFAILAKSPDAQKLLVLRDKLVKLARDDAQRNKRADPFNPVEYRGVTAHDGVGASLTVIGPWLVVSNKTELGRSIVDRYLDRPQVVNAAPQTLTHHPGFAAARSTAGPTALWMFADLQATRNAGPALPIFRGKSENILAEFLFGGLLDTLRQTPYATLSFDLTATGGRLQLVAPHQSNWVTEAREHFFGADGLGAAPPVRIVPDALLNFTFYRDLSRMWRRADELLVERAAEELIQGESGLSTLFGGKDFGEEVLGLLGPRAQLVVARPLAEEGVPRPSVRLPAFALVFEMHNPVEARRELRRTFQNLVGFLNVIGAMTRQPQLELDLEKTAAAELVTSTYLPESGRDLEGDARIHFNFSPTAGFVGSQFVLASTRTLARQLVAAPHAASSAPPNRVVNTQVGVAAAVLRAMLNENRETLIARNMLEEGRSRDEAGRQIDAVLDVLGCFREAGLQFFTEEGRAHLELTVTTREAKD